MGSISKRARSHEHAFFTVRILKVLIRKFTKALIRFRESPLTFFYSEHAQNCQVKFFFSVGSLKLFRRSINLLTFHCSPAIWHLKEDVINIDQQIFVRKKLKYIFELSKQKREQDKKSERR